MKKGFSGLTKEIVISFWGAVFLTALLRLIIGPSFLLTHCIKYGSLIMIAIMTVFLIIPIVQLIKLRKKNTRAVRILTEEGVTPELLRIVQESIRDSESEEETAASKLTMASILSEGGFYDRCFETLAEVDFHSLSQAGQEEYFNIYVYTNLMLGDTAAARAIYDRTSMFFDRARMRRRSMAVLHTLGVLSYAEGDIAEAENYFMQARAASKDKASLCDCEMFLSLCYMKEGRAPQAASAARAAASHAVTFYQKRNVEGLRAKLEAAYS